MPGRRPLERIACTLRLEQGLRERLVAASAPAQVLWPGQDSSAREEALLSCEAAFLDRDLEDAAVESERLAWAHVDHAGLDGSARPEVFERGLIVTGSAGRNAEALAEHAMLFMLGLAFDVYGVHRSQRRRKWGLKESDRLRPLHGQTVLVVGLGHTGRALAVRAKAFNMRVLAFRRKDLPAPPGVDFVASLARGDKLDELIPEADWVVLAASLNDNSHAMIGTTQLRAMKRTSFMINVSRGALVDEGALASALVRGQIAGAGLDSFQKEPLDPNSSFWETPRTIVTPRFTPSDGKELERAVDMIIENLRRYRAGEPLLNALEPEDAYTHLLKRRRTRRKRLNEEGPVASRFKAIGRFFGRS
ncbi:MAG: D-2-hydroxyacid dehydrogenase [Deltaproteobacteria bacterium]|nr:D-2-hydroxyacid dehydrogenase [Deltaproteobacteria bacterium]